MSQAPSAAAAAEAKETETKQEEMQTIKLTPVQVPLQTVVANGKAQQAAQRLQTEAEAAHAGCLSVSLSLSLSLLNKFKALSMRQSPPSLSSLICV